MYHLIWNGTRCLDRGVLVVRRPDIPAPQEEREEYVIPGRDGIVPGKVKRLEPLDFDVQLNFMTQPDNFGEAFRRIKRWLSGSGKLLFSDDLDWFYNVYNVNILESERISRRIGTFTASFRCDPYVYMNAGDRWLDPGECEENYYSPAAPLYHVTASGAWTLTVNGNDFTGSGEAYIDTDRMIAYNGSGTLINTSVVGDYADFLLLEGYNFIEISGGTLKVKPRWRSR